MEIADTINCEIGERTTSKADSGQWLLTAELLLPAPLDIGESCFFANTVLLSEFGAPLKEEDPTEYVGFTVTGQRADRVELRLQFEPNDLPSKCWIFPGGPELDKWKEPAADSGRIISPSRLGFIDYPISRSRASQYGRYRVEMAIAAPQSSALKPMLATWSWSAHYLRSAIQPSLVLGVLNWQYIFVNRDLLDANYCQRGCWKQRATSRGT